MEWRRLGEGDELEGNRVRWVDGEEMGEHTEGLPSEALHEAGEPELSVSDTRQLSLATYIISSTALGKPIFSADYHDGSSNPSIYARLYSACDA
jgi:hypothetical protein